jgi:hypothetical protein
VSPLQSLGRPGREDSARSRLILSFAPRPVEGIAEQQQPTVRRKAIQGVHGMKLGKVDLGDEAQWPGAVADVPFGLARSFPPL